MRLSSSSSSLSSRGCWLLLAWTVLALSHTGGVHAIATDLALDVSLIEATAQHASSGYTILLSQAFFGPSPRMTAAQNSPGVVRRPPPDNALLCANISKADEASYPADSILLIPRGVCPFQTKVYHAQQLGAQAALIYGSLGSRYGLNVTKDDSASAATYEDISWPQPWEDYDCNRGQAYLPADSFSFDPLPYNAAHNDPRLQGTNDQNYCRDNAPDSLAACPSSACLLTGATNDQAQLQACCAWDLHIYLYGDRDAAMDQALTIPAAYLTMQQGQALWQQMDTFPDIHATLYARWRPHYNISSMLIWAMGVAAATLASYLSAGDYRAFIDKTLRRRNAPVSSGTSAPRPEAPRPPPPIQEELTVWHALSFIIMASSSLLILFYFKIYSFVKIMYALGCSKAVSSILLDPLLKVLMKKFGVSNKVVWRTDTEDFGDITTRDIGAHVLGYTLGLAWIIVAFVVRHPETLTFFWVTQDVFGVCMCVLFLQVIKMNSLKVAAALLIVAFFYDIFFVFLSPYIFSKSVMIDVATSGGPPTADPLWCEKYPDDKNCQGGDPLPMLLTMPRLLDYQGGSNLLGLGDIVLPGLLISFAARFDAAKSLLGIMGGGNGTLNNNCPERKYCANSRLCAGGYFWPQVVAYAIGLLMANTAVYVMRMGQPALLYLVPCCLGTFCVLAWRRGELADLWEGPKSIRAAETIVYGEDGSGQPPSGHAPIFAEEGGMEVPAVPSAMDDDYGDNLEDGKNTNE